MVSVDAIDEAVNTEQPGDDPHDHVVFVVDEDVCTRCALCVDRCPTGVIILGKVAAAGRGRRPAHPHQPPRLRLRRPVLERAGAIAGGDRGQRQREQRERAAASA